MQLRKHAASNHHIAWKASGVLFEKNGVMNCMYSGLTLQVVLMHRFLLVAKVFLGGTNQICWEISNISHNAHCV